MAGRIVCMDQFANVSGRSELLRGQHYMGEAETSRAMRGRRYLMPLSHRHSSSYYPAAQALQGDGEDGSGTARSDTAGEPVKG